MPKPTGHRASVTHYYEAQGWKYNKGRGINQWKCRQSLMCTPVNAENCNHAGGKKLISFEDIRGQTQLLNMLPSLGIIGSYICR